ncbi:hypothetical protein EX30DRAFT_344116 [Ascodesmis nigricans]|uniref:Aminoglycoside phosphotransferase domain-containing protein n=1 Tax=Ascodesmis nigricans TaxID=341454 RepID=A0A4S2MKJ9_9PEZI|nr:hypothetical protein EX30DRAFT_344116 [Ascodesmis nigricans]
MRTHNTPSISALTPFLPAPLRPHLTSTTTLATLWSNYGHIHSLTLSTSPHHLILKHISPPPPTSASSESHLRKLLSYRIERFFYKHLSTLVPLTSKIAVSYPVAPEYQHEAFLLEDLSREFPRSAGGMGFDQARVVVKWLAGFHAAFWGWEGVAVGSPLSVVDPEHTEGVWRQGGYWYLDTRREELEGMVEAGEYGWLEPWVETAQDMLRKEDVPGRTLVHGDLKAANVLFDEDWKRCAVYDFQYVGKGLGVMDLVYFLGTSVGRQVMKDEAQVERLLEEYYVELERRVGDGLGRYTREVMMSQLEIAMVDWFRFMAGWGFWGNGWVSEKRVRDIVEKLAQGEVFI